MEPENIKNIPSTTEFNRNRLKKWKDTQTKIKNLPFVKSRVPSDLDQLKKMLGDKIILNLPRIEEAASLSRVPLSMEQLREAMPGCAIVLYDEIPNIPLNKWLSTMPDKSAIMLYKWGDTYGHYIAACLQDSGDIQLFDSTATGPDNLQSLQTEEKAARFGQDRRRLLADIRQMTELPGSLAGAYYQDQPVQEKGAETCGRWCALRVLLRDYSEDDFTEAFNNLSVKLNIPIDIIATLLTI